MSDFTGRLTGKINYPAKVMNVLNIISILYIYFDYFIIGGDFAGIPLARVRGD
jgi:hypothetical protein